MALRTGDFWQLYGGNLPAIIYSGSKGGIHLELVLARRPAGSGAGPMAEDQNRMGRENKCRAAA